MDNHGQPWSTMVDHGQPWSIMVNHGRMSHCEEDCLDMKNIHGQPWSNVAL